MLGQRELKLLKAMADGELWTRSALARAGRCPKTVKKRLERLVELGLVRELELRRVDCKRGKLGSVKVYQIAPEGLRVIGAQPAGRAPAGSAPPGSAAERRAQAVSHAEARMRAWDLLLLSIMSDGALWGENALCFALTRAVGGSARSASKRRRVLKHLRRLAERGEVEVLELRLARERGGFGSVKVYRITPEGLEALKHEGGTLPPPSLRPPPPKRDPAELLRVMGDGGFWTIGALAKVTGWHRKTVGMHVRRLVGRGLIEAVEVRKVSQKRKEVVTVHIYRLKREDPATPPSGWRTERQALGRGGRPDLDILLAMSDGVLWYVSALSAVTRYKEDVVRWHVERLAELGFAEAVKVRIARKRGPGLAVARLYRITRKGLEALERGQLPPPEIPPPRTEPEPPESGDPMHLALWLVEWSAIATRILLHLRARNGEDTYSNVAVAAGGYRYEVNSERLGPIILRLKELNLIEWKLANSERPASRSEHPTRIVKLTDKGREVADAILKLAALLREAESF
jgi:DNA-binding MarR family transcriptional regulator